MIFTPEQRKALQDEILALLAEGKSVRSIAKIEGMPKLRTIMEWLRTDPEFASLYGKAKQDGADAWAEDILDLAHEALDHPEKANAYRVAIDALKWAASKLKPQKYGDRVEQHIVNETPPPQDITKAITELEQRLGLSKQGQQSQGKRNEQDQGRDSEQGRESVDALPPATLRAREIAFRNPGQKQPVQ